MIRRHPEDGKVEIRKRFAFLPTPTDDWCSVWLGWYYEVCRFYRKGSPDFYESCHWAIHGTFADLSAAEAYLKQKGWK